MFSTSDLPSYPLSLLYILKKGSHCLPVSLKAYFLYNI